MLLLVSTSDKLRVTSSAAVTVDVHTSYIDRSGTTFTPGRTNSAITTATTTDIVGSPGASTERNVKTIVARNKHASSSNDLTFIHTDGTTAVELFKVTLAAGEEVQFTDDGGWMVFGSDGTAREGAAATGRLLRTVILTAGTSHSAGPSTTTFKLYMVGAGGGGGGASSSASNAAVGGGGASGSYAEKTFTGVVPGTAYTYAIGTAGTAGANTGGTGGTGGNTTFTGPGAVTVTAQGGLGGVGMVFGTTPLTALGGDSGGTPTNADIAVAGSPGHPSIRQSGTVAVSGTGGQPARFGAGGKGASTNSAGISGNVGGGGSGACSLSSAQVGGAGGVGLIMVEEYA